MQIILTVFGPELQQLTYNFCPEINLEELSPCVKLKQLSILNPRSSLLLNSKGNSPKLDFLTQLKSLESDTCLGSYWSRIFEEKSSLSHISLYCCHIGTKVIFIIYFYYFQILNLCVDRPVVKLIGIAFRRCGRNWKLC